MGLFLFEDNAQRIHYGRNIFIDIRLINILGRFKDLSDALIFR